MVALAPGITKLCLTKSLACVEWRFCRAERTSGEVAGREIRARNARERAAKPREK